MTLDDELIDDYILGRLSQETSAKLEAELARQPELRLRVESWRKLRQWMRSASPDVPSERLWSRISTEIRRPLPLRLSPWQVLLETLAAPQLRYGLAGAAVLLAVGIGLEIHRPPSGKIFAPSTRVADLPARTKPTPSQAPRPLAALPAHSGSPAKAKTHEPTEVERALADQSNDEVLADMIREHESQTPEASSQNFMPAMSVALGSSSGATPVAYESSVQGSSPAPQSLPQPSSQSRMNGGLWDFLPTAAALNRRDWATANAELQAAASNAPQESQRSFAKASLYLLSQAGKPVTGVDPSEGENLAVEGAAQWQLFAENQVARYLGDVSVRIPGYRSEGPSLSISLAGNKAFFSAGTHFIAVQDERPCLVKDPSGQPMNSRDFVVPQGAEYMLHSHTLQLK